MSAAKHRRLRELLDDAARSGPWEQPPDGLADTHAAWPGEPPVPGPGRHAQRLSWIADDIRGHDGGSVVSQATDEGEISLVAHPPQGSGAWRLEGQLWLREAPADATVELVWVEDEHVLTRRRVRSGELFELVEPAGSGWVLEVHLPSGEVVDLPCPQEP